MSDLRKRDDGAVYLEDDDFVTLSIPTGYFYHECCDCGLSHRVHVRDCKELTLRFERIEAIPAEDVSEDSICRAAETGGEDVSDL